MMVIILDFIAQNWEEFIRHCKSHGLTDVDEIEKEIDAMEKKEGLS